MVAARAFWWGWWAGDVRGADQSENHKVEAKEEGGGCQSLRSHLNKSRGILRLIGFLD